MREHAKNERDRLRFDQWRPYVIMMHARAVATPFVELADLPTAITAIDAGIREIRQFLDEYGQAERAEECGELVQLTRWRDELAEKSPAALPSPATDGVSGLRRRLAEAVRDERYEEAAQLRDELRRTSASDDAPAAEPN